MNTDTTEPTKLQQRLTDFAKRQLGSIPVSSTYYELTPELLATARPYGSDKLGYDISVYPSHVGMTDEQIKNCEGMDDGWACEAITIIGRLNYDGKNPSQSLRTWKIAEGTIEALKRMTTPDPMELTEDDRERAAALVEPFNEECRRLDNTIAAYLHHKDKDGLVFVISWGVWGDRSFVGEQKLAKAFNNILSDASLNNPQPRSN